MINFATAMTTTILKQTDVLTELEIEIDGKVGKAANYNALTGPVAVGDKVIVNTTAVDLSLGTGGYSFVLWNLSRGEFNSKDAVQSAGCEADESRDEGAYTQVRNRAEAEDKPGSPQSGLGFVGWSAADGVFGRVIGPGHLMKLRYTPLQLAGLSVEEEASPHHEALRDITGIDGMPVIACELHSQLLPIAATIRELRPESKVTYIMTDGGALPAAFSTTTSWLRANGYLAAVITAGQAFGGDFEAVNIYSALAAAKWVVGADVAIVAMGPGIAGTGTALGYSGIEQGQAINAAASLGGRPIAILRLGQKDPRGRHLGISHHTVTALTVAALARAVVPVPELPDELAELVRTINDQINRSGINHRHDIRTIRNEITLPVLEKIEQEGGPKASTMGRGPDREPAFFLAAGAAAVAALDLV